LAAEQAVIKEVRRAKLFVFLRLHRHELFDEQFQAELAQVCADSGKGQPPVPPALLALATIVQAYTGVSDDEVIEATVMDRRWQLVLDCMGADHAPFSKGTLVGFRARLVAADLDRRLVERTVALAETTQGFGARALRAALDSSPLWGAGRVEDTINLMGHALRKALGVIAAVQGRGQAAGIAVLAEQAGVPQLAASSLKAALDRDWDDPAARDLALAEVLGCLEAVEAFLAGAAGGDAARALVAVAHQVRDQDVDLDGPAPSLRRGVAKDRRVSVEDGQMRHGRKSRSALPGRSWRADGRPVAPRRAGLAREAYVAPSLRRGCFLGACGCLLAGKVPRSGNSSGRRHGAVPQAQPARRLRMVWTTGGIGV